MNWEFEVIAGPYASPTDEPVWDGEGLLFTRLAMPTHSPDKRILRYDPQSGGLLATSKSGTLLLRRDQGDVAALLDFRRYRL